MRTLEYLFGAPELRATFWPPVLVGLLVGTLCSALSVPVVLKRMAFVGQGVSHAAFGGVGVALALGMVAGWATQGTGLLAVVTLFCVAAALGIAWLSDRPGARTDTAIGIVLAASMAVGFLLIRGVAGRMRDAGLPPPPGVESILFGSVLNVGTADAVLAAIVTAGVLATAWWYRRPMLFWAFDEGASAAFGVPSHAMRSLLLVVLALAIVVTMRLAGVVLATALLVLPGAAALELSDRLRPVYAIALAVGVLGVAAGLVLSFEMNWQPGPSIVLSLTAMFVAARACSTIRARRATQQERPA